MRTAQTVGQAELHREMEEVKINIETLEKTNVGAERQLEEQAVRIRELQSSTAIVCGMFYIVSVLNAFPPWGRRVFKRRIRPPYPQRVVKGDLIGRRYIALVADMA